VETRIEWMNYHHLLYFWTIVKEGGISKAAKALRLAQPTISGQLRMFEHALGEQLFERVGRQLVLTDVGRLTFRYADELFAIGRELQDALKGRFQGRPIRFAVGIADVVPKLVAYRLLEPALRIPEPVRLICTEDSSDRLVDRLLTHELDLVLSDTPVVATSARRLFSHSLGRSGVSFFAAAPIAPTLRRRFPKSLHDQPFLLPPTGTNTRRVLEQWFTSRNLSPRIAGEFDDSALATVFGSAGIGAFAAPTVIERELVRQGPLKVIGRVDELEESYYAITAERRLKHPAVVAVTESGARDLFGAQ
jgi:LysR family transcriptional regulator, transcriptional activator of nhaA